jgi:hypothetical protein
VAVDHVEVTFVHRNVDRLADGAPGMMDRRRQIGELHEIAEILDRGVAAPFVIVADEGRAIDGREDSVPAADEDAALWIPGVLGELAGCGLDERTHEALGKADAVALHIAAGGPPHVESLGIVAEIDADLFEHGLAIALDEFEPLLAQDLIKGNVVTLYIGELRLLTAGTGGAPCFGATT